MSSAVRVARRVCSCGLDSSTAVSDMSSSASGEVVAVLLLASLSSNADMSTAARRWKLDMLMVVGGEGL